MSNLSPKYKIVLTCGAGEERKVSVMSANDALDINNKINDAVKFFRPDVHWKAAVVRGTTSLDGNHLNEVIKATYKEARHSATFVSFKADGYTKADANYFVSERGLIHNTTGKWAKKGE